MKAGDRHYRAYVGPPNRYDILSALQFNILTLLGLRENHFFLDIGCGSLRVGRLLIPYLLKGHYFGIEPEQWLIDSAIANEIGSDIIKIKEPSFDNNADFNLGVFSQQFDFITAQSIFTHASSEQIKKCLAEARQVMKPNAIFLANFREGNDNYAGTEWVYPGVVDYTFKYMKQLVEEQNLVCRAVHWPDPRPIRWLLITNPSTEYLNMEVHENSSQQEDKFEIRLKQTQAQIFNLLCDISDID